MSILLHEYGHFLQWRDGFLGFFDAIGDAHETFDQWWQKKIELNDNEIRMYRNIMLAVEYDAEVRSYNVGKELLVKDFNPEKHLQEAYSYIASIKWAWENRMEWSDRPEYDKWPAKLLTQEELFAPLTDEENKILKLIVPAA